MKYYNKVEESACSHCNEITSYKVKYHLKKMRKDKKVTEIVRGQIISKIKKVSYMKKVYDIDSPSLCAECKEIPVCESCGVIMCKLKKYKHIDHTSDNPKRCISCIDWESKVKDDCARCEKPIFSAPNRNDRYLMDGNFCRVCIDEINERIRFGKEMVV